jgi:hypothetical protein
MVAQSSPKFRLRTSHKIVIGAIIFCAAIFYGYKFITEAMIMGKKFEPLQPSSVNLIGVDTAAGYRIIVANQVAQLVFGASGEFGGERNYDENSSSSEKRKRIPIREMLEALQGDKEALGSFVMKLNDISDAEFPAYPIVWTAEDIQKAIDGDAVLAKRLSEDLNVDLEGQPLETIKVRAIQEGILIDSPITVKISHGGVERQLSGRIREQYQPRFMSSLDKALSEKANLDNSVIRGYYLDAARKLQENPSDAEDVRSSLKSRISPSRLETLAKLPEQILNSITIIVNDTQISGASKKTYRTSDNKQWNDLLLNLNEDGRQRLWQYSKKHLGDQLLVVWDGIAIAAPRIATEIPFAEVTIKQIADEGLVEDAVEAINSSKNSRTNNE